MQWRLCQEWDNVINQSDRYGAPAAGIYIVVSGGKATKQLIR